jgi:hypothetical protein
LNILTKYTFIQNKNEFVEGFGSLFQREILAYILCLFYKKKFLRTKLFFNKHINRNLREISKFNNLFNFLGKKNLKVITNKEIKQYQKIQYNKKTLSYNIPFEKKQDYLEDIKKFSKIKHLKKNQIYNIPFKVSLDFLKNLKKIENKKIFSRFRKNFWSVHKKMKNEKVITIVIHLRCYRKNIDNGGFQTFMYQFFNLDYGLPNYNTYYFTKLYVSLIKNIIKENKLNKKQIKIILCSTGTKKIFFNIALKLSKLGKFYLHVNKSDFNTFKSMLNADHLILSHSSFSYVASFINEGKKYIRNNFRHPLPQDVKVVRDYEILDISYLNYFYYVVLEIIFIFKLKISNRFKCYFF